MDFGCLDMGCTERQSIELSPDNRSSPNSSSSDSLMATSKIGKNKAMKDAGQSSLSTLNKCTSQIRKPPHRKMSPLNWFPRKKVDSYLKRKIRLLQEVDGMNSTLDETLGDSNLHYSKVLKEKIAVREAATKAMEARKAAMVEASWCKILHAARIECKDAEAQLLEAEKNAADAFEAATSIGVIMYDTADCAQKYYKIETSAGKGGSTHAVSASFETAFEVDKQVASAVKVAFTKLANCPSINKDEFRELLRKISQNPDSEEISQEFSSGCESDTGSEFEVGLNEDSLNYNNKKDLSGARQMKFPKWQESEKFGASTLVEMMLERLKGLHEDELASLTTIVATCGLNAALAERESHKKSESDLILQVETGSVGNSSTDGGQIRRGLAVETGLPSLDKFLVKRLTRLEREVLEAKNARKNEAKDGNQQKLDSSSSPKKPHHFENENSDSGTMLVKHSSKLEKEIAEARRKNEMAIGKNSGKLDIRVNTEAEMPSLDKFLIRHVSRLEKEVQEAKNRRSFDKDEGVTVPKTKKSFSATADTIIAVSSAHPDDAPKGKENIDHNKSGDGEMDMKKTGLAQKGSIQTLLQEHEIECLTGEAIPKEVKVLPREDENHQNKNEENNHDKKKEFPLRSNSRSQEKYMKGRGNGPISYESLDKVLVKHVSRLEKEKMKLHAIDELLMKVKQKETDKELDKRGEESLDQILVKHKTRFEREMTTGQQPDDQMNHSLTRREAREKELQEAWGGLSLGNSIRPQISKLERHKISSEDHIRHSSVRKEAKEKELQEAWGGLSLGNSIRPHISKLERHKISSEDQIRHSSVRKEAREKELQEAWGGLGLGNSIKPHVSKLERYKTSSEDQISRHSSIHKEAREKELQDSWGGLSLGNSIRPHLSRLERDKAAWLKAEEEERRRAMEQQT